MGLPSWIHSSVAFGFISCRTGKLLGGPLKKIQAFFPPAGRAFFAHYIGLSGVFRRINPSIVVETADNLALGEKKPRML